MAALDFPSAPTVGQQYFAPNGAIYAWDGEAWTGSGAPTGTAAGGDLTGTYPDPLIGAAKVTRAKTATDLWLSPIPAGGDVGRFLGVAAGPTLTWTTAGGGGAPSGPAGGDLTGSYPDPTIAAGAVSNVEISDVAWSKITGAPAAFPPTGTATGDLTGSYPGPTIAAGAVGNAEIADVAWGKITGAPTILQFSANVTPTGTRPGTAFTVPQLGGANPVAILAVLNGLVLDQVTGAPAAVDEFRLVGTALTTSITVLAADKFKVFLWY
jgi:Repeat of unknown function (DUF5907)